MPLRERGHTAQTWPVTRPSNVNDRWTTVANPGSSAAAGVVPGARLLRLSQAVNRVIQTLQSGSVAQVEVPMHRERIPLQGSGGLFVRPGGAGRVATTKGLTGIDSPFVRCAGAELIRNGPLARWLCGHTRPARERRPHVAMY